MIGGDNRSQSLNGTLVQLVGLKFGKTLQLQLVFVVMECRYLWNLALLSSLSFGGHFSHSSLTIFAVYFVNDKIISPTGLGILFASSFLTSLFLPLLVGILVDSTKRVKLITFALLFLSVVGQALFVLAIEKNLFYLALAAQMVFGSGASSVSAIQRISIAYYLKVWS